MSWAKRSRYTLDREPERQSMSALSEFPKFIKRHVSKLVDLLRRSDEKQRLSLMHRHALEREQGTHHDFMSVAREAEASHAHLHRVEQHGAHFWKRYYQGERPFALLRDDLILPHKFGSCDEQKAIVDHMLDPECAIVKLPTDGVSSPDQTNEISSRQRCLDLLCVAEIALARGEFTEAERDFRIVLDEIKQDAALASLVSKVVARLGYTLRAQGRNAEAASLDSVEAPT